MSRLSGEECLERVGGRTVDRGRRLPVRPGWFLFVAVFVLTVVVMGYYGVGYVDVAKFGLYTLFANTVPGLLIFRAVRGHSGYLVVDAAVGCTLGLVVELPVYLVVRAFDEPAAVVAWPVLTVVLFAVVPSLRRNWRGSGQRLPAGVGWTLTFGFVFVLVLVSLNVFRWNALAEPLSSAMHIDFPFQFALVGEFKHNVPLSTPWVTGTDLQYHWYVYVHGAAASWLTGIEPQTLVLRLMPVPMVAAFLVLTVALVHRLTGRWWPANLAVVLMLIGVAVCPFDWSGSPTFSGVITDNLWVSPTQTFAALLFVTALFVLTGILCGGREQRRAASWLLFACLIGAVAGAKATFLPMICCGLLLAVVLRLLVRHSVGAEAVALLITLFWFAFAQFVLYGGGSQGAQVYPLQTIKWTSLGQAVMGLPRPVDHWTPLLLLTGAGVVSTAFGGAGMIGLARRAWRMDPIIHTMAGFAAAGVGGMWLIAHPGLSQTYFGRSASPYLAVLSAVGLSALVPPARVASRAFGRLAAGGSAAAAIVLVAVRETVGHDAPIKVGAWSLRHALTPYLAYAVLLAVVTAAVLIVARRLRLTRRLALAAAVLPMLAGTVASGVLSNVPNIGLLASGRSLRGQTGYGAVEAMPPGAVEAGRWLREHSDPHDVVATNSHCRRDVPGCDSRDFWLAAYSERQIVVEGWSYTEPAFETGGLWDGTLARSTFWDQPLLAANDAVFYQPNARNVAAFTAQHHVRWLVAVDHADAITGAEPDRALGRYAIERYDAGDITVYEVRSPKH